nr:replication protein A 70 kDa DNA-binding subunit B-like [Ipomoea batatas]
MTDDFSAPLTESVPLAQIRPQPSQVQSTFFNMYQVVDAFDNDGTFSVSGAEILEVDIITVPDFAGDLTDPPTVIVECVHYLPKDIQVKQNSQRLIDFVIEDCREIRLTVTLWDEHEDSVLPFFNGALTDPLIVILQLCRARVTDDGEIRISSSYTATRVLFNYECPELFAFKDRFLTPIRSISSRSRNTGSGSLETMSNENITVTSLMDIYDDKKIGEFWVVGEISDIQRDWYFIACANKGCGKKLQEINDQMYWITASELKGKYSETMKFMIVTREDQFKYRGNAAFTVLGVQADEAINNSFKKGEQGSVIRKLAEEKEFNENFGQVKQKLEAFSPEMALESGEEPLEWKPWKTTGC